MTPPITARSWRIGPPGFDQVTIDEAPGLPVGKIRYAVRLRGSTLNKAGEWEYEPSPSSRDDDYIERCRWASWEDAANAAIRAFEQAAGRG